MKKLAAVSLLICALSLPAFGGHTVVGNYYCSCQTPGCLEDYPGECHDTDKMLSTPTEAPNNGTADYGTTELGIALVAILLWLRLKA